MNKKEVSLITYHRAYNYGAVLQTYASIVFFEKYGYKVSIIDYTPEYLQNFGTLKNTFNQIDNKKNNILKRSLYTLVKTPSYKKLKKVFDTFVDNNFNMTKPYNSLEELKYDTPKSDIYCSGSDQIWNNYYTGKFDGTFFLNFLTDNDKCISLASSFGKNQFNDEEKDFIKKSLKKYDILTVRESDGKKLIDNLGLKNSTLLYDPTILVDYDYWNKFASDSVNKEKYILVYQLHGDSDAYEKALTFAKKEKLKVIRIITMYHQIRKGCKNIIIPEIPDFVGLFKNAEYVFTDSFHGTVFSIVFSKKVGVRLPVRFSNRITSLLESIDSKKIIIDNLDEWKKNVNDDYMKIANQRMYKNREKMISDYLKSLNKFNEKETQNGF